MAASASATKTYIITSLTGEHYQNVIALQVKMIYTRPPILPSNGAFASPSHMSLSQQNSCRGEAGLAEGAASHRCLGDQERDTGGE